jgi:predicted RNase H-like nuclease
MQSWGIVPKIREVDEFLRANTNMQKNIKESHPELCFWSLVGKPMNYSKKEKQEFQERLDILKCKYPASEDVVDYALKSYLRRQVQKDDIVDALCLAVSALIAQDRSFRKIPNTVEVDEKGIVMQMLY